MSSIKAMLGRILAPARQPNPTMTVVAIFLGAFFTGLYTRMFAFALPDLRGELGLDISQGVWLSTALGAGQLLTAPWVPWIANVIGPVRVIVLPSIVLTAALLLTPFAGSFEQLFVLHALAGLSLGIYLSLTLGLSFHSLKPKYWLMVLALYGLRVSFGLNTGVELSDLFLEDFGWRWVYLAPAAIPLTIAFLIWKSIPLTSVDWTKLSMGDWGGIILFCTGLALIYTGVEHGELAGWLDSGLVVSCLIGGGAMMLGALINIRFAVAPFGDLIGLSSHNVRMSLLISSIYGLLAAPNAMLIPTFLVQMGGLKSQQIGPAMLVVIVVYVSLTPLAIYLARRIDARFLLIIGLSTMAVTALMGTGIDHEWRNEQFMNMLLLSGFGQCFTFMGLIVINVANSNPLHSTAMLAYVPIVRILMPTAGVALISMWIRTAADLHRTRLNEGVQAGDPDVVVRAADGAQMVSQIIAREAQVLAYIDAYRFVFWVAILALALSLLIAKAPPHPLTAPLNENAR